MRLTYAKRHSKDDLFFNMKIHEQRNYVARCLEIHPKTRNKKDMIDYLISLRKYEGAVKFYRKIGELINPAND